MWGIFKSTVRTHDIIDEQPVMEQRALIISDGTPTSDRGLHAWQGVERNNGHGEMQGYYLGTLGLAIPLVFSPFGIIGHIGGQSHVSGCGKAIVNLVFSHLHSAKPSDRSSIRR